MDSMMSKLMRVMAVLILALVLLPGSVASAADTPGWVPAPAETRLTPPGGKLEGEGFRFTVTPTSYTEYFFGVDNGKKYEVTASFSFDEPPTSLLPGGVLTMTAKGTMSMTPGYRPYLDPSSVLLYDVRTERTVANIRVPSSIEPKSGQGTGRLSLNLRGQNTITKSGSVSYTVPEVSNSSAVLEIKIGGTDVSVTYVYHPGKAAPTSKNITLKHFPPFDNSNAGSIADAGNLIATVKDAQGNGIKGETVVFYVDDPFPSSTGLTRKPKAVPTQLGDNFYDVIEPQSKPPDYLLPRDAPIRDTRKYLGWGVTDGAGNFKVNYLSSILPYPFARELVAQNRAFPGRGKISGTVKAWLVNPETGIEREASTTVEFLAMAQIVRITGEGRPDNVDPWRDLPGKVRVKRTSISPPLDYQQVTEGFLLMPEDIVDIDGNAGVEIVWVTGDTIAAKVADKLPVEGGGREPFFYPPNAEIQLLSSADESGFPAEWSTAEKANSAAIAYGVQKGIELLFKSYVGKPATEFVKFLVAVYKGVSKKGSSDPIKVMTMVRLRSEVMIDNTGADVKIYNIEGSPDIRTPAGGEVTLTNGKMVTVSDDGKLSAPQTFDVKAIESKFQTAPAGASPATSPDKLTAPSLSRRAPPTPAKVGISVTSYVIRAAALSVAIIVVLALRLRMKKKKS